MNKQRRKIIAEVTKAIRTALEDLRLVLDEESAAFDNLPEGLQMSDRGEEMEAAADALDCCIDIVSEQCDEVEDL